MEQSSEDLNLYFLNKNIIKWVTLSSFKVTKLRIPSDYLIQDILQLPNKRLIINGAKRVEKGYKEHTIFIYDSADMTEIDTHKFGIVGFKMIYCENKLFFLSDKKCQVYCMDAEQYSNIADMPSMHINPGCCSFNKGIVVIGGLNNRDIDLYSAETNEWTTCGKLETDLFSVSCIQINANQVLIVSYKDYYKLDVHLGKIIYHGVLPAKSKTVKISNLVEDGDYVYCVFGSSTILKYSIPLNRWTKLSKGKENCCLII